jgi:hypothetical protein
MSGIELVLVYEVIISFYGTSPLLRDIPIFGI